MRNKFLGTGEPGYHPLRKVRTVLSGLRYAVLHDISVAYKLIVSTVVLGAAFALREWVDFLVIAVATAMVLSAEMMNTAIEALCDFVEPRHSEKIRIVKDIAAGAVGVAILAWLAAMVIEASRLWRHFAAS
ncbi:MAG: diacylglycerol kinase [Gammaproteobacteria bacterium]